MKSLNTVLVLLMTFAVLHGTQAMAAFNYQVNFTGGSNPGRYIPSAMFNSAEIYVSNNGVQQAVWYISSGSSADNSLMTILSTPATAFRDIRLQCNTEVTASATQQTFYAGNGQNCAVQFDLN